VDPVHFPIPSLYRSAQALPVEWLDAGRGRTRSTQRERRRIARRHARPVYVFVSLAPCSSSRGAPLPRSVRFTVASGPDSPSEPGRLRLRRCDFASLKGGLVGGLLRVRAAPTGQLRDVCPPALGSPRFSPVLCHVWCVGPEIQTGSENAP
jgi:hypothetical protein